ncbi:MAG: ice-binding family protein [Candidatus Peribacter sp.]|nr:ice-binding family protein [Candidatus Peribacter sp.]
MLLILLGLSMVVPSVPAAHAAAGTAPGLGTAASYAIFGAAGVTNNVASPTHIWGNVGADLLASITNLDDATQVDGTIIAPTPAQLLTDITTAYNALASQQPGTTISLSGPAVTVTPGVYTVSAAETLNGTVTLDGAGVYIFGSDSAFTVGNGAKVLLTNGATACNVFWQIPSAMTIGTTAEMVGTIITNSEAITLNTSATLQGRALFEGRRSDVIEQPNHRAHMCRGRCIDCSIWSNAATRPDQRDKNTGAFGTARTGISDLYL